MLAWDFSIVDASDTEIARSSKTWAGWNKAPLTNADQYVVQIPRRLPDRWPLWWLRPPCRSTWR
ncbi:hypothetical protein L1080_027710 [Rhodococcus sp. MSC1_016]|uniref:phospholipid scramblase family protein n=1 Tax=Rhodococcus sp. MSC1_016 TaxID=2909266 RepID=UPI0020301A04|nr:phospholipid scramblase family protein [Rhodococcus sp. MSC1_016]